MKYFKGKNPFSFSNGSTFHESHYKQKQKKNKDKKEELTINR